jgi:hypothetical protein
MKKRNFFLCLFGLVILSCCLTPAWLVEITILTDPQGDVVRYTLENPQSGTTGDFYPEIDIKAIFINGTDLVMEFYAPPNETIDFSYNIYVDNNSDNLNDFWIKEYGGNAYLADIDTTIYWDFVTSMWYPGYAALPYTIEGNTLVFRYVVIALPDLADATISATTDYIGEAPTWYYRDTAFKSGGIPAFSWLISFFTLLTLLALILVIRNHLHPI